MKIKKLFSNPSCLYRKYVANNPPLKNMVTRKNHVKPVHPMNLPSVFDNGYAVSTTTISDADVPNITLITLIASEVKNSFFCRRYL